MLLITVATNRVEITILLSACAWRRDLFLLVILALQWYNIAMQEEVLRYEGGFNLVFFALLLPVVLL